jgi:hypothetical protein
MVIDRWPVAAGELLGHPPEVLGGLLVRWTSRVSPNPERSDETVDLTEWKEYPCGFRSLAGVPMGACKWLRAPATSKATRTVLGPSHTLSSVVTRSSADARNG